MTRKTLGSSWNAIGAAGEAVTIRNISAESVDLLFAVSKPSGSLGDLVDLWTIGPAEGAVVRSSRTRLTLWGRASNGGSVQVGLFSSLAVVTGEGFYELAPVSDGLAVELLTGGNFNATTGLHWGQSPDNTATVTHANDGLTMTPASSAFSDRAQVFQGFPTEAGTNFTVTVTADQVPSPDTCYVLVYDAIGGLTLVESQSLAAPGELTFDFVAPSSACEIHLRVLNTTSPGRFLSASVKRAA